MASFTPLPKIFYNATIRKALPVFLQNDVSPGLLLPVTALLQNHGALCVDKLEAAAVIVIMNKDTEFAKLITNLYSVRDPHSETYGRAVVSKMWVFECIEAEALLGPPSWGGHYVRSFLPPTPVGSSVSIKDLRPTEFATTSEQVPPPSPSPTATLHPGDALCSTAEDVDDGESEKPESEDEIDMQEQRPTDPSRVVSEPSKTPESDYQNFLRVKPTRKHRASPPYSDAEREALIDFLSSPGVYENFVSTDGRKPKPTLTVHGE